jgi:hypothetical protein
LQRSTPPLTRGAKTLRNFLLGAVDINRYNTRGSSHFSGLNDSKTLSGKAKKLSLTPECYKQQINLSKLDTYNGTKPKHCNRRANFNLACVPYSTCNRIEDMTCQ